MKLLGSLSDDGIVRSAMRLTFLWSHYFHEISSCMHDKIPLNFL